MPHQCLKCGKVFEEGSSQLLKGCPNCNGNRFFYTKKPLDENQRKTITKKVKKDINETIIELMGDQEKDLIKNKEDWVNLKPKEVKKVIKKQLSETKKKSSTEKENLAEIPDEDFRSNIIEKLKKEADRSDSPETIDIEKTGRYRLDLKGLLEEEPIIIQKDGSYTIHLPSVFKSLNKEK